jgi:membrane protein implicated in regulation of membrane protease activity
MRAAHWHVSLPRQPLLRALALIAGAVLLAGVLATGLLIGTVVIAVAALTLSIRRWLHGRGRRPTDPGVIEGEFTVVPKHPPASLPHAD